MSYTKIPNLYKDQTILMFKECWAMEKIHGTSAHISWNKERLGFFSSLGNHENLRELFDAQELLNKLNETEAEKILICGEFYGGQINKGSVTYGKDLKFIAFDINVDSHWLSVPNAHKLALELGLEFVHYQKTLCDISLINTIRDMPSVQAVRNGVKQQRKSEGIVLRPLIELQRNNGSRICAKHKREDFNERKTEQPIDSEKLKVLEEADAIAQEWVTENRLNNILSHVSKEPEMSDIPQIVKLMIEDVQAEAKDEIVESKEARKAIGKLTVKLFKKKIMTIEPSDIKRSLADGGYQPVRPKNLSKEPKQPGDE